MSMVVPHAMFFVVPVIVTERPNVTDAAIALIVRLPLGFPGLGGFAATAGPAQTRTTASAAPIFFMSLERRGCPQVGYTERKRSARRRSFHDQILPTLSWWHPTGWSSCS